jgi:hypothetical protein
MAVHVDEVHTQVSAGTPVQGGGPAGHQQEEPGTAARPGAREDSWRRDQARVSQLRCRVAAEAFDD